MTGREHEHDRSILHILLEAPKKCKKDKFEECLNAILDSENGQLVKYLT